MLVAKNHHRALRRAQTAHLPRPLWRRVVSRLLRLLGWALGLGALAWGGFYALLQTPLAPALAAYNPAYVRTTHGAVQGYVLPAWLPADAGARRNFYGIPYAQAPVGQRRFAAPAPAQPWPRTKMALLPGKLCAQPAVPLLRLPGSTHEDCLTLNISTPYPAPTHPVPVMVLVHGGGFATGSGVFYLAGDLAAQQQVVVVSMNYRLGPLGFLAHPALQAEDGEAVGNYGLLDQQAALDWVKANAAAFGGDAANITLFGQSAGGTSLCAHLTSPKMAGQFQRVAVQSGLCSENFTQSLPAALAQGEKVAQGGQCQGDAASVRACLRALPVPQLLATMGTVGLTSSVAYRPVYGTPVLPQQPLAAVQAGQFHRVPLLVGTTRDEGTLITAMALNEALAQGQRLGADTPAAYAQWLARDYPKGAALLQAQYPAARFGSGRAAAAQLLTDSLFACDAHALRQAASAHGAPVYGYEFADAPRGSFIRHDQSGVRMGAFHGSEFAYLFYNPLLRLNDQQQNLARQMKASWANFARSGAPQGAQTPWPPYGQNGAVLRLHSSGNSVLHDYGRVHQCDFWQQHPLHSLARAPQ